MLLISDKVSGYCFSLAPTACVFGIPDYFKEIKINCSACLENNETKLKGKESCLFFNCFIVDCSSSCYGRLYHEAHFLDFMKFSISYLVM